MKTENKNDIFLRYATWQDAVKKSKRNTKIINISWGIFFIVALCNMGIYLQHGYLLPAIINIFVYAAIITVSLFLSKYEKTRECMPIYLDIIDSLEQNQDDQRYYNIFWDLTKCMEIFPAMKIELISTRLKKHDEELDQKDLESLAERTKTMMKFLQKKL